jgi:hypothetical protein
MSANAPAFTIVHRNGEKSETVTTGLSRTDAKRWLEDKARELQARVSDDFIVKTASNDESWAAVESE